MHPSPSTETNSARMETSDASRVPGMGLQYPTAPVLREYGKLTVCVRALEKLLTFRLRQFGTPAVAPSPSLGTPQL